MTGAKVETMPEISVKEKRQLENMKRAREHRMRQMERWLDTHWAFASIVTLEVAGARTYAALEDICERLQSPNASERQMKTLGKARDQVQKALEALQEASHALNQSGL